MTTPNPLAVHYSLFRVAERLLLTGHSHQAWPDVAFRAQQRAWLDAAEFLDDKWSHAEAQAAEVRRGFARLLGDRPERIALGQNTHELVTRWLSALPLVRRPRVVTTTAEFHTIRRQVDRLAEEGIEVVKEAARPVATLAERLASRVDSRTACVMVSSVLFDTAEIVPHLDALATKCQGEGAQLLVDAYHHLNVVPFDVTTMGLSDAFVTGGGYKYCQLGEGNCFLRVPPGRHWRPVLTGWFAEFDALERAATRRVSYGEGAAAFAGATYDPTAHYRGAAVFEFHRQQGLTAERLRHINHRQVALLAGTFERLDIDPTSARIEPISPESRAGFLAIHAPRALEIVSALRRRSAYADARGEILRLGPAPYLRDDQVQDAVRVLGEVLASGKPTF